MMHAGLLAESLKAGFRPDQPRVPSGHRGGGQWTGGGGSGGIVPDSGISGGITGRDPSRGDHGIVLNVVEGEGAGGEAAPTGEGGIGADNVYEDITAPETWANPDIIEFERHWENHAWDFGGGPPDEYANRANKFYQRGLKEKLPTVETSKGYSKIYDPKTNSFGVYNPNGKTETFYKPTSQSYYQRQVQKEVGLGGRVINPLGSQIGPENPGHSGTRTPAPPFPSGGGGGKIPQKPVLGPRQQ